jgi:hypothetical protein
MSKQIKQFRFYGIGHIDNYPNKLDEIIGFNSLFSGELFTKYMPITQIGIQSLPGTKFYLNDISRENPIIIGYTGLYELNLENIAEINSLSFELESLKRVDDIDGAYLIIDIVYDKEE